MERLKARFVEDSESAIDDEARTVNGGGMLGHWGVAVQGKGPFKRPA